MRISKKTFLAVAALIGLGYVVFDAPHVNGDLKTDTITRTQSLKTDLNFAMSCKHSSGSEYLMISTKRMTLLANTLANSDHGELELIQEKETPETYIYRYSTIKPYENSWYKRITGISINRQSLNLRIASYNLMPKFDGKGNRLQDERWDTADNYRCSKFENPSVAVDQLLTARLGHLQDTMASEEKKKQELEDLKKRQKI